MSKELRRTIVEQIIQRHEPVRNVHAMIENDRDVERRLLFRETLREVLDDVLEGVLDDAAHEALRVMALHYQSQVQPQLRDQIKFLKPE